MAMTPAVLRTSLQSQKHPATVRNSQPTRQPLRTWWRQAGCAAPGQERGGPPRPQDWSPPHHLQPARLAGLRPTQPPCNGAASWVVNSTCTTPCRVQAALCRQSCLQACLAGTSQAGNSAAACHCRGQSHLRWPNTCHVHHARALEKMPAVDSSERKAGVSGKGRLFAAAGPQHTAACWASKHTWLQYPAPLYSKDPNIHIHLYQILLRSLCCCTSPSPLSQTHPCCHTPPAHPRC